MQEVGVPGYDASAWLALLAPAATPSAIVNQQNAEIAKAMALPETNKALYDAGVAVALSTPEAMSDYMVQGKARWGKVVKESGMKIE